MLGTLVIAEVVPVDVPAMVFRNDVFMARTTLILGKKASDNDRSEAAGISRNTLNRLRRGTDNISLRRAIDLAGRLGLGVDDLFEIPRPVVALAA